MTEELSWRQMEPGSLNNFAARFKEGAEGATAGSALIFLPSSPIYRSGGKVKTQALEKRRRGAIPYKNKCEGLVGRSDIFFDLFLQKL
jgi:hypothetical protein